MFRRYPIAFIVVAQLFGTSLWFSPNSAADDLVRVWQLSSAELGYLTSAVQLGFIAGTLLIATTGFADRYSASRIFFVSSIAGAIFNAIFALAPIGLQEGIILRFFVGLSLAGIYPIGMKLVVGWSQGRTGAALGLLVAMLTLGTALPHGIRAIGANLAWETVILTSSVLAAFGAILVLSIGDGPYFKKMAHPHGPRWGAAFQIYRNLDFRAAAFGYFGHMWELYAFWAVVPFLVQQVIVESSLRELSNINLVAALSFVVIASGAIGSISFGSLSKRIGSPRAAGLALFISGMLCFSYPMLQVLGPIFALAALTLWGIAVVADSAQFSSTAARVCPKHMVGSALAIMNCIGFLITIASILLVTSAIDSFGVYTVWLLLPGPIFGLFFMRHLLSGEQARVFKD